MRHAGLLLGLLLVGCASAGPPMAYERLDGRSIARDPALIRQFEADKTACIGQANQALISSAPGSVIDEALERVMQGCMANKGYLLRPRR